MATSGSSSSSVFSKIEGSTTMLVQQYEETLASEHNEKKGVQLSLFERIIGSHPPILESLLDQLPTGAILKLSHASPFLRDFLQHYPLAWKTLSFRLPASTVVLGAPANSGIDTPNAAGHLSKAFALDKLLIRVVVPAATALKSLDLDNTGVSGLHLVSHVLQPRIGTLQHLSVRGCKNVSIKYHIVPFLQLYTAGHGFFPVVRGKSPLALRSLYTYRCRHHRRRPYLPSSLQRRDSDSEPTHELIELCYELGIWTDTAWCPTPGARCFRRKEYHAGRPTPGNPEVWVPFDRLWRGANRIGPSHEADAKQASNGRLWEDAESGHDGEALMGNKGEGKELPAHLRQSHRLFVENVKCDQCDEIILERCEQCSVRMHCMGCRKTLCASCAFNRPLPKKRQKTRHMTSATAMAFGMLTPSNPIFHHSTSPSISLPTRSRAVTSNKNENRFWWAPGHSRSPNLMSEASPAENSDSDSDDTITNITHPPQSQHALKLNMQWCCLEPIFSQGGGIAFLGPGLGGKGGDRIRAAPLPRQKDGKFEDPDFTASKKLDMDDLPLNVDQLLGTNPPELLPYLTQTKEQMDLQAETSPRSLCDECYKGRRWKVQCRACKRSICKEHDFRGLKIRRCGWREMHREREDIKRWKAGEGQRRTECGIPGMEIPEYKGAGMQRQASDAASFMSVASNSSDAVPVLNNFAPLAAAAMAERPVQGRQRSRSFSSALGSPHRSKTIWNTSPRDVSPSLFQNVRDVRDISARQRTAMEYKRAIEMRRRYQPPAPGQSNHPVKWEGCGAYFCQGIRPVGDTRPRCLAGLRECEECRVLVCEDCQHTLPTCPCIPCTTSFHCPHCISTPKVREKCRFEEEERQRKQDEELERKRRELERLEKERADALAGAMGEFWMNVWEYQGVGVVEEDYEDYGSAFV